MATQRIQLADKPTLDEVATDVETLKELQIRARENGVETTLLTREQVLELEPMLSKDVVGGLLAPTAGIIDPFNLCVHLMENAIDNGVELVLEEEVTSIKKENDLFIVNILLKISLIWGISLSFYHIYEIFKR